MKIICIGRNYADHAAELNHPVLEDMLFFLKPDTALLQGTTFYLPDFMGSIHHEIELVVKICKAGKHIAPEFAAQYYREITVGIDFTARDLQLKLKNQGYPWEKSKAFDNSAVLGHFLSLAEAGNAQGIFEFSLQKNGQIVQKGNSAQMLYTIDQIIAEVSRYITLKPGDLIFTGTPSGVGPVAIGDLLQGFLGVHSLFSLNVR